MPGTPAWPPRTLRLQAAGGKLWALEALEVALAPVEHLGVQEEKEAQLNTALAGMGWLGWVGGLCRGRSGSLPRAGLVGPSRAPGGVRTGCGHGAGTVSCRNHWPQPQIFWQSSAASLPGLGGAGRYHTSGARGGALVCEHSPDAPQHPQLLAELSQSSRQRSSALHACRMLSSATRQHLRSLRFAGCRQSGRAAAEPPPWAPVPPPTLGKQRAEAEADELVCGS